MISQAPLSQPIGADILSQGWSAWFALVDRATAGIKLTLNATTTLDFGSIPANSELALTAVPVPALGLTGARAGDCVHVTPAANVSGVLFTGVVTANNTVTVYAKNFSTGAIDPASQSFRIVVIQN